jgi:hypothetical protein
VKTTWEIRHGQKLGFSRGGLLQKADTAFFLQAVAVATDGDHVAVVKKAIEDRSCHHGIAEHGSPLADTAVAREQDSTFLVTPTDKLEEQMRRVGGLRRILHAQFTLSLWRYKGTAKALLARLLENYCVGPRKVLPPMWLCAPVSTILPVSHCPLILLTSPDCTSLQSVPTVTVPPVIVSRRHEVI